MEYNHADSNMPSTSAQSWLEQLKLAFPETEHDVLKEIASVAMTVGNPPSKRKIYL